MSGEAWRIVLVAALGFNAASGFGYRVYRLSRGGPIADVWGQAILGVVLVTLASAIGAGVVWLRWLAFVYAALFALVVMPVWILGVLLPLRPGAVDYAFTVSYWLALVAVGIAALSI